MDRKNVQSILEDALEKEIPSAQIDLLPNVKARLVTGTTQQGEKMYTTNWPRMRRVTLAALAVLACLIAVWITPQGRAFAQNMFQFFTVADEKSFLIPTEQVSGIPETSTPSPIQILPIEPVDNTKPLEATPAADANCSTPTSQAGYFCQIKAVEALAGFDAKEFLYNPKGMNFSTVAFIPDTGEIRMEFVVNTGGGYLYLRQGMADFPLQQDTWGRIPSDAVEQVSVNGQYAEIASGTYVVHPNATAAVWEPGGQLSLVWREGNRWFALEKMGDPYPIEWITKDELIKLAEGLVDERPVDTIPPLDPEYLKTVEQAESLAGFDVSVPTLLPVGYELKRVVWMDNAVRLMYGPKNSSDTELFIFMGQLASYQVGPCTECPPAATETVRVGPWSGWYWRGIFNASAPAVDGQSSSKPIWDGDAPHWSLAWNSDRLWFFMIFAPAYNSGKELNKETMIKIAESLTSPLFPLEIKEAETLAGFDVFEPTWLPEVLSFKGAAFESKEWQRKQNTVKTFYSFNSDKYGSGLESNGVVLTQQPVDAVEECEICDLVGPSTEVQIVQIGNTTGEYVVGVWASDNAGNRVWQDEPYLQTLRWQAGGMAFELLYMGIPEEVTKADLIAIAESMQ